MVLRKLLQFLPDNMYNYAIRQPVIRRKMGRTAPILIHNLQSLMIQTEHDQFYSFNSWTNIEVSKQKDASCQTVRRNFGKQIIYFLTRSLIG